MYGVSVQPLEVDGAACRWSDTTLGSKDDEAVVNPCGREIDKRKPVVDIKTTGKVSPSGRMVDVGRHVTECRVWIEIDFSSLIPGLLGAENTVKGEGMSPSWFLSFRAV